MTAEAVISKLRELGIPGGTPIICPDVSHALPAEEWIAGTFARAWKEEMLSLGLEYQPESEDCDDFARLCACFAELCHARTPGRQRNTSLAFGIVWYMRDAGGGHAINFFLTTIDGEAALKFFEPQTPAIIELSENEIASIVECFL